MSDAKKVIMLGNEAIARGAYEAGVKVSAASVSYTHLDVYKRQDIYRAKATKFQIIDGKLMPPFSSIDGMGEKAAEAVEEAAKDGPYLSRDDFRQRTKASKTVIDYMGDLGLLGDLPESNQLSLFDF